MNISDLQPYLPFFVPLLLLQLGLTLAALVDWARRKHTRGPRGLWLAIILGINTIGPLLYFLFGRTEGNDTD